MRIKKHNNKNEYLLTQDGMWVRNFTKHLVPYFDLNSTIKSSDHFTFLKNEYNNSQARYPWIDSERLFHDTVVIVSDGYDFKEKQKLLEQVPPNVTIFGVHGALAKWSVNRAMNYYIVNNPWPECMSYLPRRNRPMPKCIASTRTNHEFLRAYKGTRYRYAPVNEAGYSGMDSKEIEYQIDDYRNPICAVISLAYKFGVEKLLLFCCDDAFPDERPGAEKLQNGMYIYQPQRVAHGLIDGNLHWLKNGPQGEVVIADHSSGPLYNNAAYIREDNILSFLQNGVIDDKAE